MGPTYSPDLQIGRLDNDKGYEPGNCKWVTPLEQGNNRRTNRVIVHEGRSMTLEQWSREVGIPRKTISNRLDRGRSVAEALGFQGELKPRKKGELIAWRVEQAQKNA
jgi:hypothetical protein